MNSQSKRLRRGEHPFDSEFYQELLGRRPSFEPVSSHLLESQTGFGLRVEPGHAFSFTVVDEAPNIIDLCLLNADNPDERYTPGTQVAIEGSNVTRFTRLWGTPPRSRPLCTCIGDTVRGVPGSAREHMTHGGHCNPHEWSLYARGRQVRSCHENISAGLEMVGLDPSTHCDNVNLFQKLPLDPYSGLYAGFPQSDAEPGDYIEFYAECPLFIVFSLCPYGDGSVEPEDWTEAVPPGHRMRLDVYDTGREPLGWPE